MRTAGVAWCAWVVAVFFEALWVGLDSRSAWWIVVYTAAVWVAVQVLSLVKDAGPR